MAPFDFAMRAYYRFKNGKMRVRSPAENPLLINLRDSYHSTQVGRFSKAISDWSHLTFYK